MAKKPDKPSLPRKGRPVQVWLQAELLEALEAFLKQRKPPPDTSAVLRHALQEFLQQEGFWPPQDA